MKTLLYGLLMSMVPAASATDIAKAPTTFYVVALTGTEVHEKPAFASKTVRSLPIGSAVTAQQTIPSKEVKQIGVDFALPGAWLKVTTAAGTGYIFSSDLTTRKPAVKKSRSGMPYIDLLGVKKSSRTEKQQAASGNKAVPGAYATKNITEYANCTYSTTALDACFDHVYAFRQLALNEVYHHMISSYSGLEGKKVTQPKLVSIKGNVYTFTCGFGDRDATQELQLTVYKNGTLVISSFSCT